MADGAIQGRLATIGQVAHTDGTATTVVGVTLPSGVDGCYFVLARVAALHANTTNPIVAVLTATVKVDAGIASLGIGEDLKDVGVTGYAVAFAFSGSRVDVQVTAAAGVRSVALVEAFGVEMALSPA